MHRRRRAHRWTGATVALLAAWLAVSGLLLNHGDAIGLQHGYVSNATLLNWFGIASPGMRAVARASHYELSLVDDRLFIDRRFLSAGHRDLMGAIDAGDEIWVAFAGEVLVLNAGGELIEALGETHGLPVPVDGIGKTERGQVLLRSGERVFDGRSLALIDVHRAADGPDHSAASGVPTRPDWSRADAQSIVRAEDIEAFSAGLLSYERVLLEGHTMRPLGGIGSVLLDLAAVGLLLLAMTGAAMFRRPDNSSDARQRGNGR